MKKIIALLLAVVMILSLAACAAKTEAPAAEAPKAEEPAKEEAPKAEEPKKEEPKSEEPAAEALPFEGVKLTLWTPAWGGTDEAFWDAQMAKFTAQTGAEVEYTFLPWEDVAPKYMAGFLSGEGPDVFYFNNEVAYDTIVAGNCLELTPYFTQEEIDDQLYWSMGNIMGGQYAAPLLASIDPRGMCYNVGMLKEAGVDEIPETYDEIIDAARKIKEAGVCEYPILYPMGDYAVATMVCFLPNLWSAGGDMISADGTEATLDSAEVLKVLNFYQQLLDEGLLSPDCLAMPADDTWHGNFIEEKTAMTMLSFASADKLIQESNPDLEWAFRYGIGDNPDNAMAWQAGDMIAANANSKNKEAAVALLKFLISSEFRAAVNEFAPGYLTRMNASDAPLEVESDIWEYVLSLNGDHARGLPICKGSQAIIEAITSNLQLMVMGEQTPEETAAAMQEEATAILQG